MLSQVGQTVESQRSVSAPRPSICFWPRSNSYQRKGVLEGLEGGGAAWWWMRAAQEKDEAWNRMRMKDREVLASPRRGEERVRQRWRDWACGENEGQRDTNPLSKFADVCCSAPHCDISLKFTFTQTIWGESLLSQLFDLPRPMCQGRTECGGRKKKQPSDKITTVRLQSLFEFITQNLTKVVKPLGLMWESNTNCGLRLPSQPLYSVTLI